MDSPTQIRSSVRQRDLEQIIDTAPDAMFLVNNDGLIEMVNVQAETLFGYTRNEMLGQPIELLLPDRFRGAHVGHRQGYASQPRVRGMGANLELFARSKSGEEFPIDVNLSPVKLSGQDLVAASVRDFSVHRSAEAELRKARDDARSANKGKSRFLNAASHDLRQPLQSLELYLSVLQKRVDDPQASEICDKMRKSLDVMGELLNALLDLSRFESGTIVPEPGPFPIEQLLGLVAEDHLDHAEKKGLRLVVEASPMVVETDRRLLRRILDNLVSNAIRCTQDGAVTIACHARSGQLRVAVSDTGPGIPQAELSSIFEEYYQLENPVRDRSKGLGLGLAIVKHISSLLGHELRVESEVGVGSCFSIDVPLCDGVALIKAQPAATSHAGDLQHAFTVLLVDDDPAIVDATEMLLAAEGCTVVSAGSYAQAEEHIQRGLRPDCILSDYRLPEVSGVELIERVRASVNKDIPAILITGDTAIRHKVESGLQNCTVLHKPVNTEQLISLVCQSRV